MFQKLFGGKSSQSKTPSPQEAIQQLIDIEDLLKKRQELLESKIEAELKTARENGVKNKRGKFSKSALITSTNFNHRLFYN